MKIKISFNSETRKVSSLPESFEGLLQLISKMFFSSLPRSWGLEYVDTKGERMMLGSEEDYREFIRSEMSRSDRRSGMKVFVVPREFEEFRIESPLRRYPEEVYQAIRSYLYEEPRPDTTRRTGLIYEEPFVRGLRREESSRSRSRSPRRNTFRMPETSGSPMRREEDLLMREREGIRPTETLYPDRDFEFAARGEFARLPESSMEDSRITVSLQTLEELVSRALERSIPRIAELTLRYLSERQTTSTTFPTRESFREMDLPRFIEPGMRYPSSYPTGFNPMEFYPFELSSSMRSRYLDQPFFGMSPSESSRYFTSYPFGFDSFMNGPFTSSTSRFPFPSSFSPLRRTEELRRTMPFTSSFYPRRPEFGSRGAYYTEERPMTFRESRMEPQTQTLIPERSSEESSQMRTELPITREEVLIRDESRSTPVVEETRERMTTTLPESRIVEISEPVIPAIMTIFETSQPSLREEVRETETPVVKPRNYSRTVITMAMQLKQLLPEADLNSLLEFVNEAPRDLDIIELMENYKF